MSQHEICVTTAAMGTHQRAHSQCPAHDRVCGQVRQRSSVAMKFPRFSVATKSPRFSVAMESFPPHVETGNLTDPLPIDRESAGNSTVTSQPSSLD